MGQIKDRNGNVVAEVEDNFDFMVDPYICVYEAVKPRFNEKMHLVERELVGGIKMYVRFNVREDVTEKLVDGDASVVVTKEILECMGMSEEFLFQRAIRNTPGQLKNIFCEMEELRGVKTGYDGPMPPVFVARTKDRLINGAGVLANIQWLEEIREKMGDFYIIHSSRHELIIIDGKMVEERGAEDLQYMVKTVNGDVLDPADKLSDDVYKFDVNGLHVA